MHIKYLCMSIIVFACLFVGCAEPPKSPISSIPMILIDYIDETEETKIYVHGIDDHLFSNITIQIQDEVKTENYTYCVQLATLLTEFTLNVNVWDKEKQYEYEGNLTLRNEEGEWSLKIRNVEDEEPITESLPHTIIMERKE